MSWFRKDLWKTGITIACILLLLVLLAWISVSAADAHEGAPRFAGSGTVAVQVTPTEDATMTALNKEKLRHENDWWWNFGATILTSVISTLTLTLVGIFTIVRYFNDRRDAREKRAEERFQSVVAGLGSEREEAQVGAAIMLRTFLRPGYEQFYTQTFDLAVTHLRLPRTSDPPETLSQALIVAFQEAFPLARSQNKGSSQSLDATGIRLDNAYLNQADLKQAWMQHAFLGNADLMGADLSEATLREADFSWADLSGATLREANLSWANLSSIYAELKD